MSHSFAVSLWHTGTWSSTRPICGSKKEPSTTVWRPCPRPLVLPHNAPYRQFSSPDTQQPRPHEQHFGTRSAFPLMWQRDHGTAQLSGGGAAAAAVATSL